MEHAVLYASLVTLVLACSGCANFKAVSSKLPDVAPERETRQQALVGDFERRRDDSQFRSALSAWERGDVRECEKLLVELLKRNPENRNARLTLADLYAEQQNPAAAERHYRALIESAPQDAEAHRCLAMFLEIMDRKDEAGRYFARAAELDPEKADFAATATIQANAASQTRTTGLGNETVALAAAKTSHSAPGGESADVDASMAAAAQLLRSGQAEAALRQAADAATRHPNHAGLKRLKGAAQLKLGDPKSAQVTLQQALSLDSRNALTYFLLGCTLVEQGESQAAEKQFQTAHELDPRYPARP